MALMPVKLKVWLCISLSCTTLHCHQTCGNWFAEHGQRDAAFLQLQSATDQMGRELVATGQHMTDNVV